MLRYCDQDPAPWCDGPAHRAQYRLVIVDMFDDVVGAHQIESGLRRNRARIQLGEFDVLRQSSASVGQSARMQIGSNDAVPWAGAFEYLHHGAIPAADFQIASGAGKVALRQADNQLVPGNEPEMAGLNCGQSI